ncbi:hypothetical protein J3L18_23065 [Mucilaginibacter gossypii]|uniref:hypothetical protein n=1 Tax=Mucilaginibacter gossypii TaxID=551996 RepID=UPI000DCCBD67|nr:MULTISPECIES: hypothetical protein [Mucilaginibacter]QTE35996.1 hypothetical protein J3L18_23065 [Mucilaginibacter gossypii]RAV56671.1 hypothetical protein DIU36_14820 [Mucilaginibacter rubeus]
MTIAEIIDLVQSVTGVKVDQLSRKMPHYYTYARYVAILLMEEQGYKNTAIAASLDISRKHTHKALRRATELLGDNKLITKFYLDCGKIMADLEEENV